MLTLHETLLLFALHDDRGTVHSRAWVGLDDALRGAILAEMMLRGSLEVDPDGLAGWSSRIPGTPILDALRSVLAHELSTETFELSALFNAFERAAPDLRTQIERSLTYRGAVSLGEIDRHGLEDTTTLRNQSDAETRMLAWLHEGIRSGVEDSRRQGMLVGLVHALDLWPVLLPPTDREAARTLGLWVAERDPILRYVIRAVLDRSGLEA